MFFSDFIYKERVQTEKSWENRESFLSRMYHKYIKQTGYLSFYIKFIVALLIKQKGIKNRFTVWAIS